MWSYPSLAVLYLMPSSLSPPISTIHTSYIYLYLICKIALGHDLCTVSMNLLQSHTPKTRTQAQLGFEKPSQHCDLCFKAI